MLNGQGETVLVFKMEIMSKLVKNKIRMDIFG